MTLVQPFKLEPLSQPHNDWHKHQMLLLVNSGKHYIWMCEICNERYKLLKIIFYKLLRKK